MATTGADHASGVESLEPLRVGEAMHRGIVTCRPSTPLCSVARMMAAHRIHAVVVTPGDDVGDWSLVSDLDLAAAFGDVAGAALTASCIASTPKLFVTPDETLGRAAQIMCEYEARHLIVLDRRRGRPVGILSTLDVAEAIAELGRPRGS